MDLNPNSGQNFPGWPSDNWVDPLEERAKFRLRLQRIRLGFSLLALALFVAGISSASTLFMILSQVRQPLGVFLGIPHFELIEGVIITWGSLLGVCLLWSPWPDRHWQRRSGILLMMCLVDALLWTLSHAGEMGLSDGAIGHEWFRDALGSAMGWSEFALIASLAADMAVHLGEPRAVELARSIRSLATTGAMIWFLYFTMRTDWFPPIWPLRMKMGNQLSGILFLSWLVVWAICFMQSGVVSLLAAHCCGKTLTEMAATDHANDHDVMPLSRSEEGWDDMIRKSGPKDGS